MPMLEWNDELSIKVAEVDAQHKELVHMVNKLYESMKSEEAEAVMLGIVQDMTRYTEVHFSTEEKYMEQYSCPGMEQHKTEHRAFVEKAWQVTKDIESGNSAVSMDVLNFLSNWLVSHIYNTDKKMGNYLSSRGVA